MEMGDSRSPLQAVLWDFDGVLIDSMSVRELGFREVLCSYPEDQVEHLIQYHRENGGLSRYAKFNYFFQHIRQESVEINTINLLSQKFSKIMLSILKNPDLLIDETVSYIQKKHNFFHMHVVSGSDQAELRELCVALKINNYFLSIHGSPMPKKKLVENVINDYNYNPSTCILIGDSRNDYEAAVVNGIHFMGYNNSKVELLSTMLLDLKM